MVFGRDEWVRQCQNAGSAVNILDQLYAVEREEVIDTPDAEAIVYNELTAEMEQESPRVLKMSSFLYALAIHDSKSIVNEYILKKRVDEDRAKRRAAAVRDKQAQVNVAAAAAKPTDTFRYRFENIDMRLANVEKASLDQQPPKEAKPASGSAEPEQSSSDHILTKTLLEKVMLLEKNVIDLRTSGSAARQASLQKTFLGRIPPRCPGRPKNDSGKRKLRR